MAAGQVHGGRNTVTGDKTTYLVTDDRLSGRTEKMLKTGDFKGVTLLIADAEFKGYKLITFLDSKVQVS